MFMGEYNHTIDTKGRLIIPSKFREALGDGFVVTKGLDGCLFVYDNAEWTAFEEKLKALPMTNKESRKFVRFFLAGAAELKSGAKRSGKMLLNMMIWKILQSICQNWDLHYKRGSVHNGIQT